jgi:cytoskeletal protein RodZ
MGRNEIRLRRHRISSGRIAQHRNYGDIMARHERDQKIRRIARIFIYFIIILVIILMFYAVRVWERNQTQTKPTTSYTNELGRRSVINITRIGDPDTLDSKASSEIINVTSSCTFS